MGENEESQPQHVGFDDFYGFLSVSDMYTEWRDPHFFPEIVYSARAPTGSRTCPSTAASCTPPAAARLTNVEEVTIPVLSELDEKWCQYSEAVHPRHGRQCRSPGCSTTARAAPTSTTTPSEPFLGKSPAKHPYKDTLLELDEIMGRLVTEALAQTGQLEDTLIFISSDNGPHMETWPDAAFTPFRCAKGSTWEGGVRVPGMVHWPGMIEAGRQSDGLFDFNDIVPTAARPGGRLGTAAVGPLHRRRRPELVPAGARRPVQPQVPLLLAAASRSRRCAAASTS
jgi:arylsulfatase A-like enzyme